MKKQASITYQSRFFKSDQRGAFITAAHKCFSTFNSGAYADASRQPFGALQFVNDISITAGQSLFFNNDENIAEVFLPLVGTMTYSDGDGNEKTVASEQVKYVSGTCKGAYKIRNRYEKEAINYLHLGFNKNLIAAKNESAVYNLALNQKNTLVSLHLENVSASVFGYIGVYESRIKETNKLKNENNGFFIYVINGAFEAEDRLMEHRDGLCLWGVKEIGFESLSQNAIIMLLEIPLEHSF